MVFLIVVAMKTKTLFTNQFVFLSLVAVAFQNAGVQAQTSLANGWVVTRTNVSSAADFPTDIHLMMYSLASGDTETALSIYSNGKSSTSVDSSGRIRTISLESISRDTKPFLDQSFYQLHRYGLAGGLINLTKNYDTFGDDFVQSEFQQYNQTKAYATMPGEAALVLVLYPYVVSKTLSAVSYCERYSKQEPAEELVSSLQNSIASFDQAMAYYVGTNQDIGSAKTGYSFYSLSEKAQQRFSTSGSDTAATHSSVNDKIGALFQEAYKYYSFPDACTPGSLTAANMQSVAFRFIAQTQVTLVQMLIHSMATKDLKRTKMYANALIPQLIRCKPSAYRALKQSLLDKTYDPQEFISIMEELQQTYSCLGFTCQDIGAYNNSQKELFFGQCADRPKILPMAGYTPQTDVYEVSKIDLDILEIKCYLSLNLFDAALKIYQYGHNSLASQPDDTVPQYRKLNMMATSSERSIAKPYFEMFESYNNDPDYANSALMDAFLGRGRFYEASSDQRAQVILGTLSYQVVYMNALSQCSTAISRCQLGDLKDSLQYWDSCAAGFVGSLEGPLLGGSKQSNDGVLLYTWANVVANPMGRLNQDYYGMINAKIVDALWSGQGLLLAGKCSTAQHISDELFQYTIVPFMQGVIIYARLLATAEAPFVNTNGNLGAAESMTRAILPVVCNFSDDDCKILAANMLMQDGFKPVVNGSAVVTNALNDAILVQSPYKVITCDDIGGLDGGLESCSYLSTIKSQSVSSDGYVIHFGWLKCFMLALAALGLVIAT